VTINSQGGYWKVRGWTDREFRICQMIVYRYPSVLRCHFGPCSELSSACELVQTEAEGLAYDGIVRQ